VVEKFVQRGMKKRIAVLRSPRLFQDGRLDQLRKGSQERFGDFERSLDALVSFTKTGGRFNFAPDGGVRSGFAIRGDDQQDPQVAFDNAFKATDNVEDYHDIIDLMGLGPRRTQTELLRGGAVVIRLGDGPPIII